MWKYSLPLFICLVFVAFTELGFYWMIFPAMLVANILNMIWGEFSNREISQTLRTFYSHTTLIQLKRFHALSLIGMVIWAIYYFDTHITGYFDGVLFTIAVGCLTGCFIVTLAHDLLHERKTIDQVLASSLLLVAGIPHLAGDHLFGHHRNIGLQHDASTAPVNRNLYVYLFHISRERLKNSFTHKMDLPRYLFKKLQRMNIKMTLVLVIIWIFIFFFSSRHLASLLFFIGQGAIAYLLYEIINYIQHYGLRRSHATAPITLHHSWNCYYKYTNYILYMLPLHSLHHLPISNRRIPEQQLKAGPRMPYLYFTMVFLALVPPLWFRIMNPKVKALTQPSTQSIS